MVPSSHELFKQATDVYLGGVDPANMFLLEFMAIGLTGVFALAFFHSSTRQAVETVQQNPVFPVAFGVPGQIMFVILASLCSPLISLCYVYISLFPLMIFLVYLELALNAIGFMAVGSYISKQFGYDSLLVGTGVGALLGAVLISIPVIGALATLVVGALGIGASFTVGVGAGVGTADRSVARPNRN